MSKKQKNPNRVFKRLDDIFSDFVSNSPSPEERKEIADRLEPPVVSSESKISKTKTVDILKNEQDIQIEQGDPSNTLSVKKETMTSVKKRVESILKKHLENIPQQTRLVTSKDIRKWVIENPSLNINGTEFLSWCRNPDGDGVCPFVKHFGSLLTDLGIDHSCDVDVRGYVYDFFIEPMNLYIDIDPVSLDTDDPKAKISITVNKNRVDVLSIWRTINESRSSRCKPYRFLAIKERLYAQGVKEFIQEYLDWYYQQMINKEVK